MNTATYSDQIVICEAREATAKKIHRELLAQIQESQLPVLTLTAEATATALATAEATATPLTYAVNDLQNTWDATRSQLDNLRNDLPRPSFSINYSLENEFEAMRANALTILANLTEAWQKAEYPSIKAIREASATDTASRAIRRSEIGLLEDGNNRASRELRLCKEAINILEVAIDKGELGGSRYYAPGVTIGEANTVYAVVGFAGEELALKSYSTGRNRTAKVWDVSPARGWVAQATWLEA